MQLSDKENLLLWHIIEGVEGYHIGLNHCDSDGHDYDHIHDRGHVLGCPYQEIAQLKEILIRREQESVSGGAKPCI